jgi:TRAP-type uncharacterized transport system fused permease subunit
MGLPTLGVYVLLATLVAPGLVEIGISPIAAHLFVMYYGMMSMITPPVAVAAFTAAGIAGSEPMRTAMQSVRVGWLAYVIPFVFVFSPGITMNGSAALIAQSVTMLVGGIFLVSVAMTGYLRRRLGQGGRAIALLSGCALCVPAELYGQATFVVMGAAILGAAFVGFEVARFRPMGTR